MNVADLKKGFPDAAEEQILHFYARNPPEYAVYQTSLRAAIQYADDIAKADEQRKNLTQFAPLRGEINGLLQNWRTASAVGIRWRIRWRRHVAPEAEQQVAGDIPGTGGTDQPRLSWRSQRWRARAERYDRRVADALIVALEGDFTGAGEVLKKIKGDIMDERVGWARLQYLGSALVTAFLAILLGGAFSAYALPNRCFAEPLCFAEASDLWRGAFAGALGAFFSVALGVKGRTVLTDLNLIANLTDAALRVTIGVIAGMVLAALIKNNAVVIRFGDAPSATNGALYIGIAGFLAGFSERLVPDLLAKGEAKPTEAPVVRTAGNDVAPAVAKKPAADAPAAAADPVVAAAVAAADADDTDTHVDGCVADVDLADDEVTPDEALPPASGGVAADNEGPSA